MSGLDIESFQKNSLDDLGAEGSPEVGLVEAPGEQGDLCFNSFFLRWDSWDRSKKVAHNPPVKDREASSTRRWC